MAIQKNNIFSFGINQSSSPIPPLNSYLQTWIDQAILDGVSIPSQPYLDALSTCLNTIEAYDSGWLLDIDNATFFSIFAGESGFEDFYHYHIPDVTNVNRRTSTMATPLYVAKKGWRSNATGGLARGTASNAGGVVTSNSAMWFWYISETNGVIGSADSFTRANSNNGNRITIYSSSSGSNQMVVQGNFNDNSVSVPAYLSAGSICGIKTSSAGNDVYRDGVLEGFCTHSTARGLVTGQNHMTVGTDNKGAIQYQDGSTCGAEWYGKPDASAQLVLHNAINQYLTDISGL